MPSLLQPSRLPKRRPPIIARSNAPRPNLQRRSRHHQPKNRLKQLSRNEHQLRRRSLRLGRRQKPARRPARPAPPSLRKIDRSDGPEEGADDAGGVPAPKLRIGKSQPKRSRRIVPAVRTEAGGEGRNPRT